MKYSEIVNIYSMLESTRKKLKKRDILAGMYKKTDNLYETVLLSMGIVYPTGQEDLGIAEETIKKILAILYGCSKDDINTILKETGDIGIASEILSRKKSQSTLMSKNLTIKNIFESLRKLPYITGTGSVKKKMDTISELLSSSSTKESKYIIRTILGTMRIGVANGIVRDAIALAFEKEVSDVEKLFDVTGDYGKVAELCKEGKMESKIKIFTPIRVMLADREKDIKTSIEKFDNVATEWKYDGFRIQIHKDKDKIMIFSRNLDNITKQFPDIVSECKKIKLKNCIIEGEVLAIDKNGFPMPFQNVSKRIKRKHKIEETMKEIPVKVKMFELLYADNKEYMQSTMKERWEKLKKALDKNLDLVEHIETSDMKKIKEFYENSLEAGNEGVMIKNLDSIYKPGKRVGFWIKHKPIMDPLDLVITGAEWGEGKRAGWLGSMVLSAKDDKYFTVIGKMASGLTEKQMENLTKKLKPLIIEDNGKELKIKPKIVLEIGYEEIQKSNKYKSGYAMRFPKLLRIRDDKKPSDASSIKEVEKLFKNQK